MHEARGIRFEISEGVGFRVTHVKTLPSPLKIEPVGRLVSDQVLGMLLSNRCSP